MLTNERRVDSECLKCGHWISREWEFCPCCGSHQASLDPNAAYLRDHNVDFTKQKSGSK